MAQHSWHNMEQWFASTGHHQWLQEPGPLFLQKTPMSTNYCHHAPAPLWWTQPYETIGSSSCCLHACYSPSGVNVTFYQHLPQTSPPLPDLPDPSLITPHVVSALTPSLSPRLRWGEGCACPSLRLPWPHLACPLSPLNQYYSWQPSAPCLFYPFQSTHANKGNLPCEVQSDLDIHAWLATAFTLVVQQSSSPLAFLQMSSNP